MDPLVAALVVCVLGVGCIDGRLSRDTGSGPTGETGITRNDTGSAPEDTTEMPEPDTGTAETAAPADTGTANDDTGAGNGSEDTGTSSDTSSSQPDVSYDQKCPNGPLEKPKSNCRPSPIPDTGNKYADCVARINQYRLECQCLPPLERWKAAEDCADQMAKYDAMQNSPHAGFRNGICSPRGRAQNECPGGYRSIRGRLSIFGTCLQQMWDEGPGEDFQKHGHYLNMASQTHSKVACGFYEAGGEIWAVQNFR